MSQREGFLQFVGREPPTDGRFYVSIGIVASWTEVVTRWPRWANPQLGKTGPPHEKMRMSLRNCSTPKAFQVFFKPSKAVNISPFTENSPNFALGAPAIWHGEVDLLTRGGTRWHSDLHHGGRLTHHFCLLGHLPRNSSSFFVRFAAYQLYQQS